MSEIRIPMRVTELVEIPMMRTPSNPLEPLEHLHEIKVVLQVIANPKIGGKPEATLELHLEQKQAIEMFDHLGREFDIVLVPH